MRFHPAILGALSAGVFLSFAACASEAPTEVARVDASAHHAASNAGQLTPEARAKIVELRQWSAPFHNPAKAAAAGYTTNIGCLDETLTGVARSEARGMGYHIGAGPDGFGLVDLTIDIDQPEFLVFAPTKDGGSLETARLVALDYFQPDPTEANTMQPAPLLGNAFVYSPEFDGWIAHIYLWGDNPEGMFENWNGKVPLCTAG